MRQECWKESAIRRKAAFGLLALSFWLLALEFQSEALLFILVGGVSESCEPVLIAPSMNTNMLGHDAVQRNLRTLATRGTRFVDPGEGYLACGWIGKGRLAEPEDIVAAAERILAPRDSVLRGRRVVVTAGPTYS